MKSFKTKHLYENSPETPSGNLDHNLDFIEKFEQNSLKNQIERTDPKIELGAENLEKKRIQIESSSQTEGVKTKPRESGSSQEDRIRQQLRQLEEVSSLSDPGSQKGKPRL